MRSATVPKTVKENGGANYFYEIIQATNNEFKVHTTAVTDFNGNGIFNVWEIDQNGVPKFFPTDTNAVEVIGSIFLQIFRIII